MLHHGCAWAVVLSVGSSAAGQTAEWIGGSSSWGFASRWTTLNVPDAPGESALIAVPGTYTILQDIPSLSLDSVAITNPLATLNLNGNEIALFAGPLMSAGILRQPWSGTARLNGVVSNEESGVVEVFGSGTIDLRTDVINHGRISIGVVSSGTINCSGPVSISGIGTIEMGTGGWITASGSGSMILGEGQTLRGRGTVLVPYTNDGLISATIDNTYLDIKSPMILNRGTMEANLGTLRLTNCATTQEEGGTIVARDDSFVDIVSGTLSNGTLRTFGSGYILSWFAALSGVTLEGDMYMSTLYLDGPQLVNNGTVHVRPKESSSTHGNIYARHNVRIDGQGDIDMSTKTGFLHTYSGATLTIGPLQRVHGRAGFYGTFVNEGLIEATHSSSSGMGFYNSYLFNTTTVASRAGSIEFGNTSIAQPADGTILADGGVLDFGWQSTVRGGRVEARNGGSIRFGSSTTSVEDVHVVGGFSIPTGSTLSLRGSELVNDGVAALSTHTASSGVARLLAVDSVTIRGNGQIELRGSGATSEIATAPGVELTLGSGQEIFGSGAISGRLINEGLIHARVPSKTIRLTGERKINRGQIRIEAGSTLEISGSELEQSDESAVEINGGLLRFSGAARLSGGEFRATNGGRAQVADGSLTILSDIRLRSPLDVRRDTTLTLAGGVIHNDDVITLNLLATAGIATLIPAVNVRIEGDGTIHLMGRDFRSLIASQSYAIVTIGPDQSLIGEGQIGWLTNEGTIGPGTYGVGDLHARTAESVIVHMPGSSLDIEIANASSFDRLLGGHHQILGGDLRVTLRDGYAPEPFTTHAVIVGAPGSSITGRFDSLSAPALPSPFVWKVGYRPNELVVGASCPSDVNSDFIVDIVDFLDFLDAFGTCDGSPAPCAGSTGVSADYNGDTFVDILDFLDFFDAFGSGC